MRMMTPMKKKMPPAGDGMRPMSPGIAPLPEENGQTESTVNDAFDGGGKIVLNVSDYPKLEGIEAGALVNGQWEGTADASPDKDGNVPVTFVKMEIETDNSADRALEEMKGQPGETPNENEDDEL